MNASKSKFFRRYAYVMQLPYRRLKREWAKVPRNKRWGLRVEMCLAMQDKAIRELSK